MMPLLGELSYTHETKKLMIEESSSQFILSEILACFGKSTLIEFPARKVYAAIQSCFH